MKKLSIAAKMVAIVACLPGASVAAWAQSTGVLTQHYDQWRSGSNSAETILTPSSISSDNFGVIATVNNLADIVVVPPLVLPNVQITCPLNQTIVTCQTGLSSGQYEVAYVAAANTIYAINAANGQILLQRNFGPEGHCRGIRSTPVISNNTLYVITVTAVSGHDVTTINAIHVGTLTNAITPYTVTPTNTIHALTDGTAYSFDVDGTCPRTALLSLGGNIYEGFRGTESPTGSGNTRGWLMAWNAATLAPLPPLLTDLEATAQTSFFLSSIWMSGSGIASDGTSLYFSTGNSDPSGTSYSFPNNIEESVVKVTQNLKVTSIFTPSNFAALDAADNELGSGGVAVLPAHGTPMVVAAGKDGRMFLLNSASLGGFTAGGPDKVLDTENIGGCWCAPSFFPGPDGIVRVVSSGGNSVMTWKVQIIPPSTSPKLVQEAVGQIVPGTTEDPGFFTSVSSNGDGSNPSRIIWAVGRPTDSTGTVTLYAFDANPVNGTLPLLGQYAAGTWTDPHNANIIPVVANGKVYVASGTGAAGSGSGILTIFGLNNPP